MPSSADWNALVPASNRYPSPNRNSRKPAARTPTHIVIHITGTNSLARVKMIFLAPNSVSSHYLVTKDGELIQFIPDAFRAWHAGIESTVRALYRKGPAQWTRYLRYFAWYEGYPADARYVNGDLQPVRDKTEAVFVARADGLPWSEYDYFFARWPGAERPVNYDVDPDPNNYSIGIETLGLGAKTADPETYTPAMYASLRTLVADLSQKYEIPMVKGRIIGHEDVNPVNRFGWDPSSGFDWSQVYSDA